MLKKNIPSEGSRIDDTVAALLESLPDAVYLMDTKGVILNTNSLFASQLGKQPQECIGANIYDLLVNEVHMPELAVYHREKSEEVLRTGKRTVFANERDVRKVTMSPVLSAEGEITRLLITIQNIAEQKRIDRELHKERALKTALLDTIPCSAVILDSDLQMVVSNQYARDMLFGKNENREQHVDPASFFFSDDMALLKEKFQNTLKSGIDEYSEIKVKPHGSTQPIWMMTHTRRVEINGKPCAVSIGIDITERKLAEERLHQSKEWLDEALSASHSGIWEWTPGTNKIGWSDEVWDLFGMERTDEKPAILFCEKVVHPDDREKIVRAVTEAENNNTVLNIEYRVCHQDGSVHWLMSRGKPLCDKNGHVTRYIGTVIDITERKLNEIELKESKIRFGFALDAARSGIWEWNVKTDELSWSEQVWGLYGLKVNSVPLNNRLCVDTVHPEDRDMASRTIHEAVSNETSASVEYRVCHPDGSVHWLASRGMPLHDADGKVTRYIGTIIDITERKQIETDLIENRERLGLALEAARAGVWEWDLKTYENIWSDEIWPLYGLERDKSKPSFDLWSSIIHPDDREQTIRTVTAHAKSKTELNIEYRICRPDGSVHWMMSRGKPHLDSKGSAVSYIGTMIDITERKEMELALKESKKRMTFALEATDTGVWEWDVNNDNVIWTDNVWKLYGMEQNSLPHTHKLCESNIYPDDRDLTFEKVMAAASKEIEINIEYRVAHKDGSIHWLLCHGVPSYDTGNRLKSYIGTVTDITGRKELMNNLTAGRMMLEQALEAARAGVWEWNLSTGENVWSDETWLLYGLEKSDRKPSFDLWKKSIHTDDRERTVRTVTMAAENETELNVEYRISHVNGSVHWLMSRGKPLYNKHGKVDRYIGTIIDITGRKEIEEQLQKSQERLDFILEKSHFGVWDVNLEDGSTARTLEHARIFGYETIPPVWSLEKFYDHIIPADRTGIEALVRNSIEKKENYSFECRIRRANGELRWIRATGVFKFDKNSKAYHILGLVYDITEQKLVQKALLDSELKFRTIFDHAPVAIAIRDVLDGKLFDVNLAWQEISGYTKAEIIGQRTEELGLYGNKEDYENNITALNEQGKILNQPLQINKKSGETVHVLYSGELITLDEKPCILVMMTDITRQELQQVSIDRLEQIVADRTMRLNQEVKRLNSFLHMISHEYRTPLAIIRGNLDLIELKNKHCNCVNPVEMNKIRRAINRLVDVMEESMHESRVFESRTALLLKPVRIVSLIASQIESFRSLWPDRAVQYSENLDTCEIFGDSSQLKLAFFNLLDNARKYSEPDSTIELDCRQEGDEAVIRIRNQGSPITDHEAKALFEKYQRGSNSMNTGGAGLGLWLVKSIIDQHNGHISLKGIASGVEATIRLPLFYQAG